MRLSYTTSRNFRIFRLKIMIIQSVSPDEFEKEMYNEDVVVFDVRAPEEHIHF
jgi:hypothetical protein